MKPLHIRHIAVATICLTLNTGCMMAIRAATRQQQPDPGRLFDSADSNGDGVITREEFLAARDRLFTRLDRNGDGYIDKDDISGRLAGRQKAQERFAELVARFDKDGDGRASRAEFVAGSTWLFDQADTDHNGELTKDEVAAAKKMARAPGS
ncbi:MAG TPA: EF-hand domain-containing protein [Steroidobacteraceae bacterium]